MKIFFSMNNHEVATPEMMLEEARSYVMFCGEADGKVSAYIGLYLLQTGRRLFYAHSSNPFSPGEMGSVEDEALCFVEGLGALVDEIDIAKLSAEAKGRWIDDQDIFSLEERPERSPEAPVPPPAEAETVKEEPQAAAQPYAPAPEEVPQPQTPIVEPVQQAAPAQQIQPASQPAPVPPVIEIQPTPQMPPLQAAPQPRQADQLPSTAATAPLTQLPPAEEPSSAPENEATSQPAVDAEIEDEAQAVPSPADIAETGDEPRQRPASPGAAPADAAFPAPDRARQRTSARAAGSKSASSAAPSTGRQDIRQKTTKDDSGRPPKPSMKRRTEDNTGVVRRDREALARLLSSF